MREAIRKDPGAEDGGLAQERKLAEDLKRSLLEDVVDEVSADKASDVSAQRCMDIAKKPLQGGPIT